ncbi:hypothetical protein D1953_07485 [Peribacillus asahii]|uniref:Coupling factor for flagellin transcription and translation n=1 Tax=Peribacillus asahii TaxID=228899 RepID=A0A398BC32_9BACI|nr:hypothetical protein [Peribacillus asahii]RID87144.1 hypothetical protein D1953_07485 [Peribacillus asahii]
MSVLFMFILFLLNIFSIFAIIVLFVRQNRFHQAEKNQKAVIAEMEELMTGYIIEMKEENEALLEKLMQKGLTGVKGNKEQQTELPHPAPAVVIEKSEEEAVHTIKHKAVAAYTNPSLTQEDREFDLPIHKNDRLELSAESKEKEMDKRNESVHPSFSDTLQTSLNGQSRQLEPSLHEQALVLLEQGLSVEEIAKSLKRGKTEIELLLKFQLNE